ncbi:MAG: glycosyltransferase [Sporichthya sp.]|nr:glycosyltransferase [Sporichthya sp.]
MLSTYPPTQCGLATFTAALLKHLGQTDVVRVVDEGTSHPGAEVVAHLVNGSDGSALEAVHRLNRYDVVIVQHEYGIFGGPDGLDVVELVEALRVPTIIVFHTVLQDPTAGQRRILERLLAAADVAVTMTATARKRLIDSYGADPAVVRTIPHGAVDHGLRQVPPAEDARPLVLTWGLLGPGKGIEWAIDALPGLRDLNPRYLVLGKTHPRVFEREGEAYRDSLVRRARELGVEDLLELDDSYLPVPELADVVGGADVVLLPYDSRDQVTSGVLIEAVAAGRPVVSTGFPHAVELLTLGSGLVVPQRDPGALQVALRRVLSEPGLANAMAAQAARQAPELFWSAVAAGYRVIAESLSAEALTAVS